jgi:RimJ/RimL family protein N-acetyltransferase
VIEPVLRSVVVDAAPDAAFDLFTSGIDRWWPLREGFAYGGERARSIHLEPWTGGRLVERLVDGDELQVGTVVVCERPVHVVLSWRGPLWTASTEVRVSFRPDGLGTRVDVRHDGFDALGTSGRAERDRFAAGWPAVLGGFAAAAVRRAPYPAPLDPRPDDVPWPSMSWPVPAGTELTGRHVTVRALDPDRDAAALFHALDHPDVWRHVRGRPPSVAAMHDLLAERVADPGWQPWIVARAGRVVGTSSYLEVAETDARLEVGFTLYARDVWGSQVNPDCKLLLLGHAFDTLGAGRVQLKTDIRNVRSQQAIDRLGARFEGVLRRYQRRADGSVRDTVVFSVVAEEWPEVRRNLEARLAR